MDRDQGAGSLTHAAEDGKTKKGRLMGKLFGRDRKASNESRGDDAEINDFLHGSGKASSGLGRANSSSSAFTPSSVVVAPSFDSFQVSHAAPPQLAKLDTSAASRYPNALPVTHSSSSYNTPSGQHSLSSARPSLNHASLRTPRRTNRKGLTVGFTDSYPEIIGEGGDESEIPTMEIGKRRRALASKPPVSPGYAAMAGSTQQDGTPISLPLRSPMANMQQSPLPRQLSLRSPMYPPSSDVQRGPYQQQQQQPQQQQQQQQQQQPAKPSQTRPSDSADADFAPRPLRRTQTGYSTISDLSSPDEMEPPPLPSKPSYASLQRAPETANVQRNGSKLSAAPVLDISIPTSYLKSPVRSRDDSRRSYIEVHQAEMREAEGRALANALRLGAVSPPSSPELEKPRLEVSYLNKGAPPPPPRHPERRRPPDMSQSPPIPPPSAATSPDRLRRERYEDNSSSPSSVYDASPTTAFDRVQDTFRTHPPPGTDSYRRERDQRDQRGQDRDAPPPVNVAASKPSFPLPSPLPAPMTNLHSVVQAASDEALNLFAMRTRHLFELFRLHSETLKPLLSSTADELARAALWWFVIGRMALENVMRASGGDIQAHVNDLAMQQAYADLAKAYWVSEEVLPEILSTKQSPVDNEVVQVQSFVVASLRKLSMSMLKNNMLPPEDAFLPQTIDKSIWAMYPPVSSDVTTLLWGYWGSSLTASASLTAPLGILESIPLSDSATDFVFSRIWADVYLMEQGHDASPRQQRLHFPCLLSVVRPQNLPIIEAIISSQNGAVQLRIQSKKNPGPMWEDVRWRPDVCSLELRLPRGFVLIVQLSKVDYGFLWNLYDYGAKVHSRLYPRQDEHPVFRRTLKAFQYFETGQPSGNFPKEAVPDCEVALFEKILVENAATGRRNYHRGFRLSVVSGTRTRTLYGISQSYPPEIPLQFSFLRGDTGDPALLLRFENSRSKGSMVLSFASPEERMQFHTLMAGTALQRDERVVVETPVSSLQLLRAWTAGQSSSDDGKSGLEAFKKLTFNRVRVVNYDDEADDTTAPTVLAESLRMVFSYGDTTVTDRINVAPGELKIRLDVRDSTCLVLLRQPQKDLTVAVSEAQAGREIGRDLGEGLRGVRMGPTCRMVRFPTMADLHAVQEAITGFRVVFDGMAAAFAIARRRMVVPIHKKWEAGTTRIQVVVQADTKVTQLLAFFQDFHYGQCMNFVLKGTDVFETFSRSGKAGLKFDDAKFPLPRMPNDDHGSHGSKSDGMIAECHETAFVCLDMPDLPGEHDDISILFDKEAERDRLTTFLPAPVRGSRLGKKF